MAKTTTPITIDDQQYTFEDMTQEQQALVNHVADLERKLANARFQMDQLVVGRDAFLGLLKNALQTKSVVDDKDAPTVN